MGSSQTGSSKIEATHKELSQVRSYAKAVAADPRFADTNTIWDFWLVTATVDGDVQQSAPSGAEAEESLLSLNSPVHLMRKFASGSRHGAS